MWCSDTKTTKSARLELRSRAFTHRADVIYIKKFFLSYMHQRTKTFGSN